MNAFDLLSPDGHPIFVTRLTNTPGQDYPHHEYVRSAEDYDAFIKRNDKPGLALYHAVARLKEGAARSKENVESSHYVWTDIDYKDHPDIEASEIKRRILEGPNPPSFIVLSGGGVHPYHRLKEPVDASPGPAQAELERALKLSCSYYGGDPQAAEAARLLRMPGSTNSKRGTPIPVEATAISDRTYELSDLIEFWSEAQPLLPSPKKEKKINGSRMVEQRQGGYARPTIGNDLRRRGGELDSQYPALGHVVRIEQWRRCHAGNRGRAARDPGIRQAG